MPSMARRRGLSPKGRPLIQQSLPGGPAAIDIKTLPGDVAGGVTAQESRRPRHLVAAADALQHSRLREVDQKNSRTLLGRRMRERPGRHGVDADVAQTKEAGHVFGHLDDTGLAGTVLDG